MTSVSTHVLDAVSGGPATGVPITLIGADDAILAVGHTDRRRPQRRPWPGPPRGGHLPTRFDTAAYFAAIGISGFYPEVVISFEITDDTAKYHVPLLLSPYAYSTYRGSRQFVRDHSGPQPIRQSREQVVRVYRDQARHEIHDVNVSSCLRGDFSDAHLTGDQAKVLTTDAQKQTAYAFSKEVGLETIEDYGLALARHYARDVEPVDEARIEIDEYAWERAVVDGANTTTPGCARDRKCVPRRSPSTPRANGWSAASRTWRS